MRNFTKKNYALFGLSFGLLLLLAKYRLKMKQNISKSKKKKKTNKPNK